MVNKMRLICPLVVEGKYDKIRLSNLVETPILVLDGFSVFNDREKVALLRRLASVRGLILLTDSDGAGFQIRNYLKGAIPASQLKHAYIPDVPGKERRKAAPGKEGKLGVEGMTPNVILESLRRAGATMESENTVAEGGITKQDLMELGLSGGTDSSIKRRILLKHLQLPEHMSSNAMLQALNLLLTKEELTAMVGSILE